MAEDHVTWAIDTPTMERGLASPSRPVNQRLDPLAERLLDTRDAEGERRHGTTAFGTAINAAKCFSGASSFSLPWAFSQAGLVGSLLGLVVFAVLSNICLRLLADLGHLVEGKRKPTYPEVGKAAFGFWGKVAVWFGMVSMTLGVCGSYLLFVAQCLSDALYQDPTTHTAGLNLPFFSVNNCMAVIVPVVLLLSFLSLRKMKWTSIIGLVAVLTACVVVVIDCASSGTKLLPLKAYPEFKMASYPLFMGNAAYLYLISTAILPLEQAMENRRSFAHSLSWGQLIVTLLNIMFAGYVYIVYYSQPGVEIQENILQNLPSTPTTTVIKMFCAVNQLFTYTLFLFPMTEGLEKQLWEREHLKEPSVKLQRNLLRLLMVAASALIAVAIPQFGVLTGLSGAFGNNLLCFVFVPVFYWKLKQKRGYWSEAGTSRCGELMMLAVLFVFGVVLLVLSCVVTFQELLGSGPA